MKVNVLTILQNMVNGAIDIINKFIGLLNKIPGVSIDAVEQVTFATTAKAENEAAKQARADALNKYESDIKAAQAQRDATIRRRRKNLLTLRPHCLRPTPTPKRKPHRQSLTSAPRTGMSTGQTTSGKSILWDRSERLTAT